MVGSIHEFNRVATEVSNNLIRHQWRALSDLFQCSTEQWQQLSRARGMDEIITSQSRFIAQSSPKFLSYAQDTLDCLNDAALQYRKIVTKTEQGRERSGD